MTSNSKLLYDNLGRAGLTAASISAAYVLTQAFIKTNKDDSSNGDKKLKSPNDKLSPSSPTAASEPPSGQSLPTVQEGDEAAGSSAEKAQASAPKSRPSASPSLIGSLRTLKNILREGKLPVAAMSAAVALTVISRAVGEMSVLRLTSELDSVVMNRDRSSVSRLLTFLIIAGVPVAILQQLSYFSASNLSAAVRQSLVDLLMKRLVLSPHNLCHPEELVDQERLEALMGDVAQTSTLSVQLAADRLKRTTELVIQTVYLLRTIGVAPVLLIVAYLALTLSIGARQKVWKQFFIKRVAERESAFKKILARLQRHRDDVALWNGAPAELETISRVMDKIETARKTRDTFEFLHGLSGVLSGKVGGAALALALVAGKFMGFPSQSVAQYLLTSRVMVQFCSNASAVLEERFLARSVDDPSAPSSSISRLSSSVRRLKASLVDLPKQLPPADSLPFRIRKSNLCLNDVTGMSPDGSVLFQSLSLELAPGGALLVHGPKGCGKSALLRLMAGTWPAVMGEVSRPKTGVSCVPSKPYLILEGSLRDQVCYPDSGSTIDGEKLQIAMQVCKIGHLFTPNGIARSGSGSALMAEADQQKLMLARLVYHRPRFALLDDCWSKLDLDYLVGVLRFLRTDLQCGVVLATANPESLKSAYPFDLELVLSNGKQPPRHEIIVHQQPRQS